MNEVLIDADPPEPCPDHPMNDLDPVRSAGASDVRRLAGGVVAAIRPYRHVVIPATVAAVDDERYPGVVPRVVQLRQELSVDDASATTGAVKFR